uniref:Uncharacterized protein n=1 Tax=Candidatus Kentrum sp. FM TaxID=2126340 RepID=A0A450SCS2_9GAMM|nr:MAG: hypothetical protein BECKFM1743C_GA0114222_100829 [Candidatus Kentron sp. FM]VFK08523.1 MAG: hypothetical protein BECKFM1743B_GA0114221_100735 [Candidatus Kentron sp. FM]
MNLDENPAQFGIFFSANRLNGVNFEWDERKNRANVHKHGLDFSDAWEVFDNPMLISFDNREDYGEDRLIGIGLLRARIVVVVYAERVEGIIRIISLRKALSYERKKYDRIIGNRLGAD